MPKETFFNLPEDKRQAILDLAIEEFAAHDYKNASISRIVERAGIYSLKDLSLTWIPNRDDRRAGCTMDDYGTAGLAFLKTTVEQMRRGEFRAVPLTEQTCRNCPERPYCPFIQKPTA